MSLPAGMQWDLLPPLNARTTGALIAGVLEPAYDIAGDAFDYAVSDGHLHFAIIDGMGHGIGSTLLTGLAVGAYRHARRGGASVSGMHAAIDAALAGHYDDLSFATGIVGRLATGSPGSWSGRAPGTRRRCCCAAARSSPSSLRLRRCRSGSVMAFPARARRAWSLMTPCCCTPTG